MIEGSRSWPSPPVDFPEGGREPVAAERPDEFGIDPRIGIEMIGDVGAVLDFAEKMRERRGAEPMQMLDEALAPEPILCLIFLGGGAIGKVFAAKRRRFEIAAAPAGARRFCVRRADHCVHRRLWRGGCG